MNLEIAGKCAFVSGSSSGLGRAIALELAAEGASVIVHGRDRDRTADVAERVSALGVKSAAITGDLRDDIEAAGVAERATEAMGGIDILVNNAGAVLRKDNPSWEELTQRDWTESFNLNFSTAVRMCSAFVPSMTARGWGRIINISSVSSSQRRGRLLDYGAAKAALDNLTVNLSKALGPKGITVNAISPGVVLTPAIEIWLQKLREKEGWDGDFAAVERAYTRDYLQASVPRIGRPREIAAAVAFLASPLSGYTNGAEFRIDGGTAL